MDPIGVKRPNHDPHATAYVEPDGRAHRRPVEAGRAYETERRRLPVGRAASRIRPAGPPVARDSLRGGARVEVDEARSVTPPTSCSGSGPSRASRRGPRPGATGRPGWHTECVVMSPRSAGRGLRHPRWRPGPGVPPPRERAGPGDGRRPDVRPPLGAQRVRRGGRREDVEVARQLHQPARPRRPRTTRGPTAAGAAVPLPLAVEVNRRRRWPTPRPPWTASSLGPPDRPIWPGRRPDAAELDRFRPPHGRRPRHAGRRGPALRPGHRGEPAARRRATRRGGDAWRHVGEITRRAGPRAVEAAGRRRCPIEIAALAAERDEARAAKDCRPGRRACATSSSRAGWVVEDTPEGTGSAGLDAVPGAADRKLAVGAGYRRARWRMAFAAGRRGPGAVRRQAHGGLPRGSTTGSWWPPPRLGKRPTSPSPA